MRVNGDVTTFYVHAIFCMFTAIHASTDELHSTLHALQLSLQFYADSYMHMNIDGIFGLRIIEGTS